MYVLPGNCIQRDVRVLVHVILLRQPMYVSMHYVLNTILVRLATCDVYKRVVLQQLIKITIFIKRP